MPMYNPPGLNAASPLTDATYDGAGRLSSYQLAGVSYAVAYPSATQITITGGGKVTTITLDASGRVIGKVVS